MSCKNCSDITLLSGEDGNGIQTVVDNGNGTFTFFFTDGSTFTTPDFTGTKEGSVVSTSNHRVPVLKQFQEQLFLQDLFLNILQHCMG